MRRRMTSRTCFLLAIWQLALGSQNLLALEPMAIATGEHTAPNAQSVAISPDGKLVAAAFGGPSNGRFPLTPTTGGIAVWNRDTGDRVSFAGEYGDIVSLSFTADNQTLLYGRVYTPGDSVDDDRIGFVDVTIGKISQAWNGRGREHVCAASPSADLLLLEKSTDIGRVTSLAELRSENPESVPLKFDDSYTMACAAFSSDGDAFAAVHGRLEPAVGGGGFRLIRRKCLTLWDADMLNVRARIVSDELSDCTRGGRSAKWQVNSHRA